jgi:hypothetical protein
MLLTSPKKLKHRESELLARTGITKAGYLLKRQSTSKSWESTFLILNDHCLYCNERSNFNRPDGKLLTTNTRVYNEHGDETVIRIETGFEVMFLKGRDIAEIKEWQKAINTNVVQLATLARGQFGGKFFMLHR